MEHDSIRWTYTYDVHGNVLTAEIDHSMDGTVESVDTHTYDYDENGRILTEFLVIEGREYLHRYLYDEQGHLIVEETEP